MTPPQALQASCVQLHWAKPIAHSLCHPPFLAEHWQRMLAAVRERADAPVA